MRSKHILGHNFGFGHRKNVFYAYHFFLFMTFEMRFHKIWVHLQFWNYPQQHLFGVRRRNVYVSNVLQITPTTCTRVRWTESFERYGWGGGMLHSIYTPCHGLKVYPTHLIVLHAASSGFNSQLLTITLELKPSFEFCISFMDFTFLLKFTSKTRNIIYKTY